MEAADIKQLEELKELEEKNRRLKHMDAALLRS